MPFIFSFDEGADFLGNFPIEIVTFVGRSNTIYNEIIKVSKVDAFISSEDPSG